MEFEACVLGIDVDFERVAAGCVSWVEVRLSYVSINVLAGACLFVTYGTWRGGHRDSADLTSRSSLKKDKKREERETDTHATAV